VPLEMVPVEVAALEAIMRGGSTGMTAPETVTVNARRSAGRGGRKHDRE